MTVVEESPSPTMIVPSLIGGRIAGLRNDEDAERAVLEFDVPLIHDSRVVQPRIRDVEQLEGLLEPSNLVVPGEDLVQVRLQARYSLLEPRLKTLHAGWAYTVSPGAASSLVMPPRISPLLRM